MLYIGNVFIKSSIKKSQPDSCFDIGNEVFGQLKLSKVSRLWKFNNEIVMTIT